MHGMKALQLVARRGLATKPVKKFGLVPNHAEYRKVMDLQTLFTREDGLLVWQKRGARDNVLYHLTMGVMVLGLVPVLHTYYRMSFGLKD